MIRTAAGRAGIPGIWGPCAAVVGAIGAAIAPKIHVPAGSGLVGGDRGEAG